MADEAELSMAIAMKASGDLKPKATRVMSRILVLTDSVLPLDKPCSIAARIDGGVRDGALLQFHERRDPASSGPAYPAVQRLSGLLDGQLEDQPEALFRDAAQRNQRTRRWRRFKQDLDSATAPGPVTYHSVTTTDASPASTAAPRTPPCRSR